MIIGKNRSFRYIPDFTRSGKRDKRKYAGKHLRQPSVRVFHLSIHRLSTTYPQKKNGNRLQGYFSIIPIISLLYTASYNSLYYKDLKNILAVGSKFFGLKKIFPRSAAVFRIFSTFFHNLSTNEKSGIVCRIRALIRAKSLLRRRLRVWICIPNSGSARHASL